ncbi:MAG: hypothetical protein VKL39_11260 [Leptolyngbyaceae bacterium]|nr:hypothetical protein [Leptolyngbyaceae bacterium]
MENASSRIQACAVFAAFCILFTVFMSLTTGRNGQGSLVLPKQTFLDHT